MEIHSGESVIGLQDCDFSCRIFINVRPSLDDTSGMVRLAARQAFAAVLSGDLGKSYDNLTADIHSRMIGTLDSLYPYTSW